MPNYHRPKISGATVFFTVTLRNRDSDLLTREIDRLRHAVAQTKTERPFQIDAWVTLPDHLHCIWTLPPHDSDYATRWRLIKTRFSRGLPVGHQTTSDKTRHERAIWQRRYWEHHIRDENDLLAHMKYCCDNPVKHGLVEKAEDWPYSSFNHQGA